MKRQNEAGSLISSARPSIKDLLERKKAQDLDSACPRTRGHATRVLRPLLDDLREMIVYGLSMQEIVELLAEGGAHVNYHSLRAFLRRHLPKEYAEHIAFPARK
jgi:hypothetical protein